MKGQTDALEQLALGMYARACSTRGIDEIFRGDSRTPVRVVINVLWKEYEEFATRDTTQIQSCPCSWTDWPRGFVPVRGASRFWRARR